MSEVRITGKGEPFLLLDVRGSDFEIGRQIGSATARWRRSLTE